MERWVPLHVAAWRGNINVVMHLVEKGADVNITNDFGRTPLHMAAALGYVDTCRILVDKGADVNAKDSKRNTALQYASDLGHAEVVRCLVEKHADTTDPGNMYHNCLYLAIHSGHKEVAVILLSHEYWEDMLKTSLKIDDRKTTPMRELIAVMPDVAEVAFNRCVTTNEGERFLQEEVHATNDTFEVQYNYEFLEDFKDKHSSCSAESWHPVKFTKKGHPLYLMMKEGCSNLLKHPLTINLLEHKWTRFGRYIFFGNLFIYLIFLAFLTAFGLVVLSPVERTCVDVFNGSLNGTAPENCEGLSIHEYRFLYVGATVTILTAFMRLAIEIFQLYSHPLEYMLDWVNWMEIPLYTFSIVFTFVFATPCLCVYSWQWQIGVVSVFLGWIGLITFLQKWPVTGVYVLMFVNILGSFMKIAFLALLLVIAFAFAFYMLLFDPDEMRTPFSHSGRAIVKVMAMTTGELDFDDLFHQQEGEDEIAFPPLSFLLWIIFLVLMPVLLSNLLVGLAVGDVDRLQKSASENRIKLQIDLVLSLEELLESLGIRHRFAIKPKACFPNVPVTLLPQWCKRGIRDSDLARNYHRYDKGRLPKVQKWIAEWYSKLWITDEYSTSGVKISDAIKPPPETIEKQLQKQRQHLDAQMQERCGHQSQQFERKLKEQMGQLETNLKEQLKIQLKEQREQIETKWKEQLAVLLKEQNDHQSEQLEAKLKEHSEKHSEQFQEAVRQLSECQKEQAKQSEELEFQTEKLAGEVVSLREALEKLVAQIAAK